MREVAAVLDAKYPRTRPTFIDWCIDNEGNGQITTSPSSDNARGVLDQDYFRITFNTVAHAATIDEVLDRFTLPGCEFNSHLRTYRDKEGGDA